MDPITILEYGGITALAGILLWFVIKLWEKNNKLQSEKDQIYESKEKLTIKEHEVFSRTLEAMKENTMEIKNFRDELSRNTQKIDNLEKTINSQK